MRLIRNTTPDGSCKYRLWNNALGRFEDDDKPGDLNEFFLIKLKDRNSEAALLAYAAAIEPRDPEFAADVRELAARAGPNHPACKDPDNAPISAPVEDDAKRQSDIEWLRNNGPEFGYEVDEDKVAALSPSLIQPAPVCVMCGAVNADPRPWDPREPVCPDCQDRRGPRPIPPQGAPVMREELEPCPFCGSRDIDPEGWMAGAPGVVRTGPACTGCGASAEDTAAWNTRAKPPQAARPTPHTD